MAKEPVLIDHKDLGLVDREHTILDDEWAYRKDEETKPYYGLTHRPTGRMFGFYKKLETIKSLLAEECFFNDKYNDYDKRPPHSWYVVKRKYETIDNRVKRK